MTAYNIVNSSGTTVKVLNTGAKDTTTCPITLIGQGISLYGPDWNNNLYRMVEHFASADQPTHPLEGMIWYDKPMRTPKYYDGVEFIALGHAGNTSTVGLPMLPAAEQVDFTVEASTKIYNCAPGYSIHPTAVMLIPVGPVTTNSPPSFNLFVDEDEDVMENALIDNAAQNKHAYFNIAGSVRYLHDPAHSLYIKVSTPAEGGSLKYKVRVFGFAVRL